MACGHPPRQAIPAPSIAETRRYRSSSEVARYLRLDPDVHPAGANA
jgi:hypothetical protein